MASDDISARIGIEGAKQAVKDLQDVGREAKKLDGSKAEVKVEADTKPVERDIKGLMAKVDKLAKDPGTILLTSNATAIANDIADLITDIDRLDADDPTVEVKTDQINKLQGDLDQIEAKIKEVNNVPVDLDTKPAKAGLDDLGKSADSSKSVLANMVGNATQDLGALGGVAGSAGVAIGQIGEYAADALSGTDSLGQVLSNFGKVAVPIAAIALVTQGLAKNAEEAARRTELQKQKTEDLIDAWKEGKGVVAALAAELERTGKIEISLGEWDFGDVSDDIAAAGLSLELFDALVHADEKTLNDWIRAQQASGTSNEVLSNILAARTGVLITEAAATKQSEINETLLGNAAEDTAAQIRAANVAIENLKTAPVDAATRSYIAQGEAIEQAEIDTENAKLAAIEYAAAVQSIDFKNADLQGALTAMQAFSTEQFALGNIAQESASAWDAYAESVKGVGFNLDVTSEAGAKQQDALEGVADALTVQLAAAFDEAGGSADVFQQKAGDIAKTLRDKLIKELGFTEEQADATIDQLGLMPDDIETRYELSGTEEAKLKLSLLQTSIDLLPRDVQAKVTQQILAGDYVGAVNTAQGYFSSHPPVMQPDVTSPSGGDLASARAAANAYFRANPAVIPTKTGELRTSTGRLIAGAHGGTAGQMGMIAGEAGAEFITLPDGTRLLLTRESWVPPGTKVTSATRTRSILHTHHVKLPRKAHGTGGSTTIGGATNITLNAAVIGNRFDVMRAVARAGRDRTRIMGTR